MSKFDEVLYNSYQIVYNLGSSLDIKCFKYFSGASDRTIKELKKSGYIKTSKEVLIDGDGKYVKDISCVHFTDKFERERSRSNFGGGYYSNSKPHDIALSNKVLEVAQNFNFTMDDYIQEKDLPKYKGASNPDGLFKKGGFVVVVEQTTDSYSPDMIKAKHNWCDQYGCDIKIGI